MLIIQFGLIACVVLLFLYFLRNHGTSRAAAGVKIGFVLFLLFAIVTVISPDLLSKLATLLGVGRGTDLLLYGLVVGFGFASVNTYLRFKELELRYARLARAIAIRGAEQPAPPEHEDATPKG
jgi:small membrane protein